VRTLVAVLLGALVAAGAWTMTAELFRRPVFSRRNVRGVDVPVGVGVLLAVAFVTVEAVLSLAESIDGSISPDRPGRVAVLPVVLGFALLGLLDDLGGDGDDRGFRGHLRAMSRGRMTTGGLKLVGGGLLAIVAASAVGLDGAGRLLLGALVIALAANFANLLDRAPGRVGKVALVAAVPLFAFATGADLDALTGVAVVVGAGAGLLVPDLRERLMLGDAGANVLGATLGLGVVLTTGTTVQLVVAAVLLALNLVSERVSFSRVIDQVGPLHALDQLGRRPLDDREPPDVPPAW
jgi:UDP-GlcNAc:undecaprenyl-phosphate/decaprenyl-phosphate GlcNAc-1-phosphate transferase